MKALNLKAEIIRLKTELEDRELVIAELKQRHHQSRSDARAVIFEVDKRATKAKSELAELRDAVAWFFECHPGEAFAIYQSCSARQDFIKAEQQLRKLTGAEDA